MRGAQFGAGNGGRTKELDEMLANSDYLHRALLEVQRSTAAVSAQVLGVLIAQGVVSSPSVIAALRALSSEYDQARNAPTASGRRLAASFVLDELAQMQRATA